ncbi:MAG: alpha/beta fold hydrolase [Planctomycetota bacterium]
MSPALPFPTRPIRPLDLEGGVAARWFAAEGSPRATVLVLGALAAPQRYAAPLSGALARAGFEVLTFDYRGVGASRGAGVPTTNLDDWGDDARVALAAARELSGAGLVLALAHSIGGMLVGHAGLSELEGALLLASSHGVPRYYSGRARLRLEAAYRVLPRLAAVRGELPASRRLLGHAVPRDVLRHWVAWGRRARFHRFDGRDTTAEFARYQGPLLAAKIAGDDYVSDEAADALTRHFRAAQVRRVVLDPPGVPPLGHFGLFRADAPPAAVEQVVAWLSELAQG